MGTMVKLREPLGLGIRGPEGLRTRLDGRAFIGPEMQNPPYIVPPEGPDTDCEQGRDSANYQRVVPTRPHHEWNVARSVS